MSTTPSQADLTNWRQHPWNIWGFTHVEELIPTVPIPAAESPSALPSGPMLDLKKLQVDWNGQRLTAQT
eukprot:gene12780-16275_t